MNKLEKKLF